MSETWRGKLPGTPSLDRVYIIIRTDAHRTIFKNAGLDRVHGEDDCCRTGMSDTRWFDKIYMNLLFKSKLCMQQSCFINFLSSRNTRPPTWYKTDHVARNIIQVRHACRVESCAAERNRSTLPQSLPTLSLVPPLPHRPSNIEKNLPKKERRGNEQEKVFPPRASAYPLPHKHA